MAGRSDERVWSINMLVGFGPFAGGVMTIAWEPHGAALRKVAPPTADRAHVLSYPDLQSATGEGSGPGLRHYWRGSLMWELSDGFLDAFVERGLMAGGGCGIELFSLGGAISNVGENDTTYSNRGATFDFLPAATWDDPADDEHNISLTRKSWEALSPFAARSVYLNDLAADAGERVREVYGSTKLERLVSLKDRWDPREHVPSECESRHRRRRDV